MITIRQRGASDCAVAATAMFLDVSYDEVYKVLPEDTAWRIRMGSGLQNTEVFDVAYKFGVILSTRPAIDPGRRALLVVPPKNLPAPNKHMVFWSGTRIHDPSPLKRYRKVPGSVLYTIQEDLDEE